MRLMAYTAHITIHRLTSVGKSLDEDPIKEHKRETETILESPGNYINRRSPGNHVLGIVSFFHKHHCNNSYSNITIRAYKIYFNIYIIIVLLYYNNSFSCYYSLKNYMIIIMLYGMIISWISI